MLTSYSDPRLLSTELPALPQGAIYLVKQEISDTGDLAQAVKRAHEASRERGNRNNRSTRLEITDGQVDVLRLMSEGLSNSEIARRRDVKEKAVEQTISRIAKRLDIPAGSQVNQRAQLVRAYFELTGTTSG